MTTEITSQLTRNRLFYVACRVAFLRSFDGLLDEFVADSSSRRPNGYLDRIPMLAGTAPQVQLECLLRTWTTIREQNSEPLTIEQQVICFAITSELAATAAAEDTRVLRRAARGPQAIDAGCGIWLASRVRLMQVTLPFAPQAAVLQVESEIAADDLQLVRAAGGVSEVDYSALLDVLGSWRIRPSLFSDAEGLLTSTELETLQAFFSEHPELVQKSE